MVDYTKRLIDISKFLKATSFFWEKELLHQDLTQLPKAFLDKAEQFKDLNLQEKVDWANKAADSRIQALISFKTFNKNLSRKSGLFVKEKKAHELSRILAYFQSSPPKEIIDLCGGMGHLPIALKEMSPDLKSTTLDNNPRLLNKGRSLSQEHLNIKYDLFDLRDPQYQIPRSEWFFGLHTCGDLAEFTLNQFINSNSLNLMSWGCCYHKTDSWSPLSQIGKMYLPAFDKFALTLAAKCFKELDIEMIKRRYRVKKYRYALELFLNNKDKFKTGSFHHQAYSGSFSDYIQYANRQLSLSLPTKGAQDFFNKNINIIEKLIALGLYRDHWGRIIESAIILDRALFLEENNYQIEIIEMFDRNLSPRNLAIKAYKT